MKKHQVKKILMLMEYLADLSVIQREYYDEALSRGLEPRKKGLNYFERTNNVSLELSKVIAELLTHLLWKGKEEDL